MNDSLSGADSLLHKTGKMQGHIIQNDSQIETSIYNMLQNNYIIELQV